MEALANRSSQLAKQKRLENVAIVGMYFHLRPLDLIAFPTKHLLGLQILATDEPNAVSSRVAVGCHVNAASRVCNGL